MRTLTAPDDDRCLISRPLTAGGKAQRQIADVVPGRISPRNLSTSLTAPGGWAACGLSMAETKAARPDVPLQARSAP